VSSKQTVVVVGGGIIGGMCAYYLNLAGYPVTILDRGHFGAACSHGNCGYVSPSHILPLTTPGGIRKALRSMMSSSSPFYIKPRFSLDLWSWLWKFSQRCNHRDMMSAAQTLHALLQSSKQLYETLIAKENIDCEWETRGIFFVFHSQHEFEEYAKTNELLVQNFGVAAKPYDGRQLVAAEPALVDGLGGAWLYECDAHLRPDKLMSQLAELLKQRGVQIIENCDVTGFEVESGRARAARTNQGAIQGGHFVVATGALTPFLNEHLGCKIPIQPGKGYSITMPRTATCPTYPMIFEEHRVAITPMKSTFRIGSTMEFAGYDSSINQKRLGILKSAAKIYLRETPLDQVTETWYGWRPMTWDSKPFIDRAPAINNAWIAAGHNMLGLSLGPVTGKLIAELIGNEQPHLDVKPLCVSRI
jgi:D-amino-acid dehydrogenase